MRSTPLNVTLGGSPTSGHQTHNTKPTTIKDGEVKIRFEKDLKSGFAPKIKCLINDKLETYGIIDTGAPFIASLPLSVVKQTDSYKSGQVIKSKGITGGGAFKASEENYLLRIKSLKIGDLELNEIPAISLGHDHALIGKKFLSQFLVTLNYPAEEMILKPYDNLDFETNIFSFGAIINKNKDGKIIVVGFWEGSSADKIGVKIGDEILMINSKKAAS